MTEPHSLLLSPEPRFGLLISLPLVQNLDLLSHSRWGWGWGGVGGGRWGGVLVGLLAVYRRKVGLFLLHRSHDSCCHRVGGNTPSLGFWNFLLVQVCSKLGLWFKTDVDPWLIGLIDMFTWKKFRPDESNTDHTPHR